MMGSEIHRIVVKVGTSTLTGAHGRLDAAYIDRLAGALADQRQAGREVLLVTSGAIRAGRDRLAHSAPAMHHNTLPRKQACAAIGQGLLVGAYSAAFAKRGITVAQVLLTREDVADRRRFLNARNTLLALLGMDAVPVINENDTVAVDEIRFGDNDMLAAHVAVLTESDLLLILSDVDGLYESAPTPGEPLPPIISTVPRVDAAIEALAGGSESGVGTGGMRTKVLAARLATRAGIRTVIAHGRKDGVIEAVLAGEAVGTTFLEAHAHLRGRKRWIAAGSRPRGWVVANDRAIRNLREGGASLLAVGIEEISGAFGEGAVVEVRDASGRRIARGLSNYSSTDLQKIHGLRSNRFEQVLGHKSYDEVIHRDNLLVDP